MFCNDQAERLNDGKQPSKHVFLSIFLPGTIPIHLTNIVLGVLETTNQDTWMELAILLFMFAWYLVSGDYFPFEYLLQKDIWNFFGPCVLPIKMLKWYKHMLVYHYNNRLLMSSTSFPRAGSFSSQKPCGHPCSLGPWSQELEDEEENAQNEGAMKTSDSVTSSYQVRYNKPTEMVFCIFMCTQLYMGGMVLPKIGLDYSGCIWALWHTSDMHICMLWSVYTLHVCKV